ncbi:MAG: hypothetical protein U1E02_17820 [Hydrogenophaga sp.]|nr:hypothetical protein [Hydrogenophaga sp.]
MDLAQLSQAGGALDPVTQQKSAMDEELSAAASALQAQARVMNDAVKIFRLANRRWSRIGRLAPLPLSHVRSLSYIEPHGVQ